MGNDVSSVEAEPRVDIRIPKARAVDRAVIQPPAH